MLVLVLLLCFHYVRTILPPTVSCNVCRVGATVCSQHLSSSLSVHELFGFCHDSKRQWRTFGDLHPRITSIHKTITSRLALCRCSLSMFGSEAEACVVQSSKICRRRFAVLSSTRREALSTRTASLQWISDDEEKISILQTPHSRSSMFFFGSLPDTFFG